jgi:hypothetical protein
MAVKYLRLALFAIAFGSLSAASAQENDDSFAAPAAKGRAMAPAQVSAPTLSPGELQATPEMWFYEQAQRRYDDPKNAVRANAEFRALQRSRRLAALRWFGLSNSRPRANPDPVHGNYSPRWVGNGYSPSHWTAGGTATIVVAREPLKRY